MVDEKYSSTPHFTVGVPLITAVSNQKIFFEPNAAVTTQERAQFEEAE